MTRRTRAALAAALVIVGGITLVLIAGVVATETTWGRDRVRGIVASQMTARLSPGAQFTIARLDGRFRGPWTADSVAISDAAGRTVFSIARVSASMSIVRLLRGDINLGFVQLSGARAFLEQGRDGRWNVSGLFRSSPPNTGPVGPRRRVLADSVRLTDGRFELATLDTNPALPLLQRVFSDVAIQLGATTLTAPDSAGGWAALRAMTMEINSPPATIVSAVGAVRWWSDSLRLDFPTLRLPGSRAAVTGTIGWPKSRSAQVSLDVRADTVDVRDVRWMTTLLPTTGSARANVAIRTTPSGALRYAVSDLDLVSNKSRLGGSLTIVAERSTEVRDLALTLSPLDLALVRNVFGDTILKPSWQGSLTGYLAGRGGRLDSLLIDTIAAAYDDARVPGAHSHFSASGALDAASTPTRLLGFAIHLDSLDVRTLGAVARAADSLRGMLTGRVTLDGPTSDVAFRDLWLQHVDGDLARSTFSGSGRIASDVRGQWLDAMLSLDTIAVATLVNGQTTLPITGSAHGTLELHATADTMRIDAVLKAGEAAVHVAGTTLLDSTHTVLDISGIVSAFDVRKFVDRRDIPATRIGGLIALAVDDRPGHVDRHVSVHLDTTARIGESRILTGVVQFGLDSTGFHLDTADISAADWTIDARGALARRGESTDSVTFRAVFDSLGVIRTLLLDSTGAPRFKELEGRLRAEKGVVRGSFESAALFAEIGAEQIRAGEIALRRAIGTLDLRDLPHLASGRIRGTVDSASVGKFNVDIASVDAVIANGESARVSLSAASGDTMRVAAIGDVRQVGDDFSIRIDSLAAAVGAHRWSLLTPASLLVTADLVEVDSLVLRSDHGATAMASGSVPNRGAINAVVRVSSLGFEELAFMGLFPDDLTGRINAQAKLTGTRDAPIIAASASVDSIRSAERARPALTFEANYAAKKATVAAIATSGGRTVLEARGDVPADLSFREVNDRLPDLPIALHLRADTVPLGDFEGLSPRLSGLGGQLRGSVDVTGTLRRPRGRGTLDLANGSFDVPRYGFVARGANASLELAGDSVVVHRLRMTDGDQRNDTAAVTGTVRLDGNKWSEWTVDLHSVANRFRVIDDPRLATAKADWQLAVTGELAEPRVTGNVRLPYAVFTIGLARRGRVPRSALVGRTRTGIPKLDGVVVSLGSDVRLKSREANVQLEGDVELFGALDKPWMSGIVTATRGTYRVDLGLIKRTFRVDSGSVIVEGTPDIATALDLWATYVVRQAEDEDVQIGAHIYGTSDRPRLDLTSSLGTAVPQSEIISYLVFGQQSFSAPSDRNTTLTTASAALVPSVGGVLEGFLGTLLPFFSTLQVSTVAGPESVVSNPVDGLLSNLAVTGGRQIGSDSFFSVTAGRCGATRVSSGGGAPFWMGTAVEYRPKRSIGAAMSVDPGPSPCSRTAATGNRYQFGFDLSYDWRFGKKR